MDAAQALQGFLRRLGSAVAVRNRAQPGIDARPARLARSHCTRAHRHADPGLRRPAYDEAEERLDGELLAPQLDQALADLSANDRRAVELRVVEERSYDQIGDRLAITPAAARTRVYRALSALRASLKGS